VIGNSSTGISPPGIFLTTSTADRTAPDGTPDPVNGSYGIQAFALDLQTGRLRWQWQSRYDGAAAGINTPPAPPALMDVDGDGTSEYLVFGDLAGRLWAIDAASGAALGGVPAYRVEGGAAQPIGAAAATQGAIAVFGTGGAAHADDEGTYALYAVEILPSGGRLLWKHQLEPGEKVWSAPSLDQLGHIYFAASTNYRPEGPATHATSTGRLVSLDRTGQPQTSTDTDSAIAGRVQVGEGLAVAVSLTGQVYQFGTFQRTFVPEELPAGPMRLFSWRLR
jgi:glucose dehydrogenase